VIGVLPCAGATQVIKTFVVPEIAVVGAAGTLGATNTAPLPSVE
jgi:hypothetical protein